jgi:Sec-independent protein translocase protein TatA
MGIHKIGGGEMNIGFTQIVLVLLVGFLLFGNVPKKVEELSKVISTWRREEKKKDGGSAE